jgi:hypothetical protein
MKFDRKLMTIEEVDDILTCALETPESPLNVDRIETLVNEIKRLHFDIKSMKKHFETGIDLSKSFFLESERRRIELEVLRSISHRRQQQFVEIMAELDEFRKGLPSTEEMMAMKVFSRNVKFPSDTEYLPTDSNNHEVKG